RDIQLDVKETRCESCGDLCGEEVDCRIWTYQGKEYTVAPKAMIIDAILREVYGSSKEERQELKEPTQDIPENLKRFFAAKQKKEAQADQAVNSATNCCLSKDVCSPNGCCG
ncbi:MAG: DUF2703 domain-containing protein, partial [Clostridia bacterium]|nr:DUF2703 domain-containing protein [Clostridia bacterium]